VCTPAVVCTTIGNTGRMKIRKIGDVFADAEPQDRNRIHAIGEIGRRIWKRGLNVT
jgi:hypothetical protein